MTYDPPTLAKTLTLSCFRLQHIDKAFRFIGAFMNTHLEIRKKEIRQEISETGVSESSRHDVFSRLVLANEFDTEKHPLDAEELVRTSYSQLQIVANSL